MQGLFAQFGPEAKYFTQIDSRDSVLEEGKRATTSVQNGLAFFFLFS